MSLQVITQEITGAGPLFTPTAGTDLFFATGVNIASTTGSAVDTADENVGAFVSAGAHIHGSAGGLRLSNSSKTDKWIEIDQGGLVSGGSFGISLNGNKFELTNRGQVAGGTYGMIYSLEDSGHSGRIVNSGSIVGGTYGLAPNTFVEAGVLNLINSGLIWGGTHAIDGSAGMTYRITNKGELRGIVELGNKSDLVDNVSGKISGQIQMLDGNDMLRPGANVEVAVGGLGTDLLDFSRSGAVNVLLTNAAANTGAAAGDSYSGFENIFGSLIGSDKLGGDGFANLLDGQGGNDALNGGAGNDTLRGGIGNDVLIGGTGIDALYGGFGKDTLTGGADKDTFVFKSIKDSTVASSGRDIITDFNRSQGDKIDLKAIDAGTKAGGDQAFKFIGTDGFHKVAGELNYVKKSGDTFISGDINGDGKADFTIVLDTLLTLKATDFIL